MANEELVTAVKSIMVLAKSGKSDEAYAGYKALFASEAFAGYPIADQRQALKLMILAKGIPTFPTAAIADAHKSAMKPLRVLIAAHEDPADFELLGLCESRTGDDKAAMASFQRGLDIERARDPQSPLCGTLMKRVASV